MKNNNKENDKQIKQFIDRTDHQPSLQRKYLLNTTKKSVLNLGTRHVVESHKQLVR